MRQVVLFAFSVGSLVWPCRVLIAQESAAPNAPKAKQEIIGTTYDNFTIGNPVTYENLSIFPISSKTFKNDDHYTTLDEGLAAGSVKVFEIGAEKSRARGADRSQVGNQAQRSRHETQPLASHANQPRSVNSATNDDLFGNNEVDGDVNKLMVQNNSGKPLYLMPGEIISGGKQDRVIGQEMVIASDGKATPIDVFCVEQGRWTGRSLDATSSQFGSAEFNRNHSVVVSQTGSVAELANEAKSGRFVASVGQLNKDSRLAVQQTGAQGKVWEEVRKTNSKLGNKSDSSDFAANYFSGDLSKEIDPFIKRLRPIEETKQIVGVATAVNGKMLSVDLFESTPLFKNFWPKLIKSYALDALAAKGESNSGEQSKVAIKDCVAFLEELKKSKVESLKLANGQKVDKRDSEKASSFSYYNSKTASEIGASPGAGVQGGGGFGGSVHTSVLSK